MNVCPVHTACARKCNSMWLPATPLWLRWLMLRCLSDRVRSSSVPSRWWFTTVPYPQARRARRYMRSPQCVPLRQPQLRDGAPHGGAGRTVCTSNFVGSLCSSSSTGAIFHDVSYSLTFLVSHLPVSSLEAATSFVLEGVVYMNMHMPICTVPGWLVGWWVCSPFSHRFDAIAWQRVHVPYVKVFFFTPEWFHILSCVPPVVQMRIHLSINRISLVHLFYYRPHAAVRGSSILITWNWVVDLHFFLCF